MWCTPRVMRERVARRARTREVCEAIVGAALLLAPETAFAQFWTDATAPCLGTTAQWTNKVDVADLDGDGDVDILLANGGNYATPGTPEATRIFRNDGGGTCTEITQAVTGGFLGLSRVAKAIDVDGDGDLDVLAGGAHHTQLKLFTRDGATWTDASGQLPQQMTSIGDLEAGDIDRDGDLDLVLADWGPNNPTNAQVQGGRTRLYLNDGHGTFTEATATLMPDLLVRMSWDIELVDVDNDWDLDVLVACKYCPSAMFSYDEVLTSFQNIGSIPTGSNNYDFEPMDIDNDGDLDLVTINNRSDLTEGIYLNTGGVFTDESQRLMGTDGNPAGADDNVAVWMDVDSDGDSDLLVGSLGTDRLMINDGRGWFTRAANATPNDTPSTLGIAAADLNGDGRLDLVQGQGESAFPDRVQLATELVAVDSTPPAIRSSFHDSARAYARVHDFRSPHRAHDLQRVWIDDGGPGVDMTWYGEYLWSAPWTRGPTRICARDRQGNEACTDPQLVDGAPFGDGFIDPGHDGAGCCDTGASRPSLLPLAVLVLLVRKRRRR
jgi:MYXO-CTERM domain-containing protein